MSNKKRDAWQPDGEEAASYMIPDAREKGDGLKSPKRDKNKDALKEDDAPSDAPKKEKKDSAPKSPKKNRGEVAPKKEKEKEDDSPKSPKKDRSKDALKKENKDSAPKSPKKDRAEGAPKKEKEKEDDAPKSPKNRSKDAKKKEEKDAAPKSPKKDKGEDAMSVHHNRAPFQLVQKVKKFGRDPLYAYLLQELDEFKKSSNYKKFARKWDLIKIPEDDPYYFVTTDDLAGIAAEELYEKFMFGKTEGNRNGAEMFWDGFLRIDLKDRTSWSCMRNFETMMAVQTTYEDFMELFKSNLEIICKRHTFADENPEEVVALQNCYDKYSKCKDVESARKLK